MIHCPTSQITIDSHLNLETCDIPTFLAYTLPQIDALLEEKGVTLTERKIMIMPGFMPSPGESIFDATPSPGILLFNAIKELKTLKAKSILLLDHEMVECNLNLENGEYEYGYSCIDTNTLEPENIEDCPNNNAETISPIISISPKRVHSSTFGRKNKRKRIDEETVIRKDEEQKSGLIKATNQIVEELCDDVTQVPETKRLRVQAWDPSFFSQPDCTGYSQSCLYDLCNEKLIVKNNHKIQQA